jgi:two-component system CheB/CheR fusion protein
MLNLPVAAQTAKPAVKLQALTEHFLLQRFCPTAVLVNRDGDILYISGRTGDYLEPAAGKANWNVHAMIREELRSEVMLLLNKALRGEGEFSRKGIRIGKGRLTQRLDISAQAPRQPAELRGMAILTFVPSARPAAEKRGGLVRHAPGARARELEEALRQAHEENRTIRDNVNSAQEELKSANEELQSTNEELQSTNEELTTSKEEMQSMNEELQTVNAELQARVDELTRAGSDMKNLLDSTEIVTIFLDSGLCVRLFTHHATQLFKLIPGDVGRPLSDIVSDLSYPDLQRDAAEVLRSLVFSDKQVETRDGRWFRVRIMPYRTLSNVIDGVVITCTNITDAKLLEIRLRGEVPPAK